MSLIEVMVAVVLIAVAAVCVASYALNVSRVRYVSKQKSISLIAAQEAIDSIRALGYDYTTTGWQQRVSTVGKIPLTVNTQVTQSGTRMKLVDVAVYNSNGTLLQRFITSVFDEAW